MPSTTKTRSRQPKAQDTAVDKAQTKSSSSFNHILLASAPLASQPSLYGNIEWSSTGQALIVTDDTLYILTPCLGLHPRLTSLQNKLADVESHPSYLDRFHHFTTTVDVKAFFENDLTIRKKAMVERDYSSVHSSHVSLRWKSAKWSPISMGPNRSSFLLALTSELDLYVLASVKNQWTGDWKMLSSIDTSHLCQSIHVAQSASSLFHPQLSTTRKQQRATEITYAEWLLFHPQPSTSDKSATIHDNLDNQVWIVAGTRSGHVGVWSCQSITGQTNFVTALEISRWGIDRLAVSDWSHESDGSNTCTVAAHHSDGLVFCQLKTTQNGSIELLPHPTRPSLSLGLEMISLLRWINDQTLVYTVPGHVRAYDIANGFETIYSLQDGQRDDCDPLLPAISLEYDDESPSQLRIVLQDMSEYVIPSIASSLPNYDIYPSARPDIQGYPPITEMVQKKHDALQHVHGFCRDHHQQPSGCIVGVVRTQDPVASFGFLVSNLATYSLLLQVPSHLPHDDEPQLAKLLFNQVLDHASTSTSASQPLVRNILAHYHISRDRDGFLRGLLETIQNVLDRYPLFVEKPDSVSSQVRRWQLAYFVADWIKREAPPPCSLLAGQLAKRLRMPLFVRHLINCLGMTIEYLDLHGMNGTATRETALRIAAAGYLVSRAVETDESYLLQLPPLYENVLERLNDTEVETRIQQWDESIQTNRFIPTSEQCVACGSLLRLELDPNRVGLVDWATCSEGHVWPRCTITLSPLTQPTSQACCGCWSKSLFISPQPSSLTDLITPPLSSYLLKSLARHCILCANMWVTL